MIAINKRIVPPDDYKPGLHAWLVPGREAMGSFTPKELKELTFISTYDTADPDSPAPKNHGYQRNPMQARFPSIGKYYLEHPGLVTPLILSVRINSADEIREFEELLEEGDFGEIKERWSDAVVSVVDGQHRRGGLIWAHENPGNLEEFNPPVPVMLYFGLSYAEEAALFDTINTEQRKLPKALIEVTKGDITERDGESHSQKVRGVAFALARDVDSVWYDQINMTGARDPERKVTYEGLRRSTANMFPAELFDRIQAQDEDPTDYAKYYWLLISEACNEAWMERERYTRDAETGELEEYTPQYRLKDLVGVASLAKLGKDIISSALEHPEPKEKMTALASKLSEVDWEKRQSNPWMRSQAGFAGQKDLYTVLFRLVYLDEKPGEGE